MITETMPTDAAQTVISAELTTLGALIEAARQDASNGHWVTLLDDVEMMSARLGKIRTRATTLANQRIALHRDNSGER